MEYNDDETSGQFGKKFGTGTVSRSPDGHDFSYSELTMSDIYGQPMRSASSPPGTQTGVYVNSRPAISSKYITNETNSTMGQRMSFEAPENTMGKYVDWNKQEDSDFLAKFQQG